jgi:hypothetical protein
MVQDIGTVNISDEGFQYSTHAAFSITLTCINIKNQPHDIIILSTSNHFIFTLSSNTIGNSLRLIYKK